MNVDLTRAQWRKARASQGNGECVEVAFVEEAVAMRDSKDPSGPVLLFTPAKWSAFTGGVQAGEFDN
ncbi:DUF397 domain-containing protein [Streptomyces sp. NBC_00620]|uniref:DUF397 domain-containing protein n=1 Tax=Streptomyces sp. NBC_00620 TaxID=2903666 RepID=UPI0022554814|nr:DUF397 domain-containing protein [Streptomyces sp. NBC_00620]MCX4976255.1 DUF397 domain-containing protein [Streptomyces sp. NBC_00620]